MEPTPPEEIPHSVEHNVSPPPDEATVALHAIVSRLEGYPLESLQALVDERSRLFPETRQAILRLHTALFHKHVPRPLSQPVQPIEPVWPVRRPRKAVALPPLPSTQTVDRFVDNRPGAGGGAVRALQTYTPMDARNYAESSFRRVSVSLPTRDIFNTTDSHERDTMELCPAIAAHHLKHIIGPQEDDKAERKLVDLLSDQQIFEATFYAFLVHKKLRPYNTSHGMSDQRSARLLMTLAGQSDSMIAGLDTADSEKTAPIRRARKTWFQTVGAHHNLVLLQVMEMINDPEYRVTYEDPAYGTRIDPALVDGLEALIEPTEHLSPSRLILYAMRRYAANTLLDIATTEHGTLAKNLEIIWLKVAGLNEADIAQRTGADSQAQSNALTALHTSKQQQLPTKKGFWHTVAQLLNTAKQAYVAKIGEDDITAQELEERVGRPTDRIPRASPSVPDKASLSRVSDERFRHHIELAARRNQLLGSMVSAVESRFIWLNRMACAGDIDSLLVRNNPEGLSQPLMERCVTCPAREACLMNAAAMYDDSQNPDDGAYYAGYAPADVRSLIVRASLDPKVMKQMIGLTIRRRRNVNGV